MILFPTELERRRFGDQGGIEPELAEVALCGFGPVAAAARTAQILVEKRPAHVLLLGIAGSYDTDVHPVGSAIEFTQSAIDGVGVGQGDDFVPPPALGFPQWPGQPGLPDSGQPHPLADVIPLAAPTGVEPALLLTTCAASDAPPLAAQRRARYASAVAEDMEGFGVALACAFAAVPLRIVRGISNQVGDRRPEHWRIPAALAAARRLALDLLRSAEPWGAAAGAARTSAPEVPDQP